MASTDTQPLLIPINEKAEELTLAEEEKATEVTTKVIEKTKAKKPKRSRELKLEAQNAHLAVVLEAAQTVTGILKARGISCAVFGSLASKLYGCTRHPKDVDLLVSQADEALASDPSQDAKPPLTAAQLKTLILDTDPRHFYLKMPRDPTADYRILWYRTSYLGPDCKVDILTPGTLHLPHLKPERVTLMDNIPVVPFSLLLYQKLQGWDDHCQAEEKYKKQKQQQDAADVKRLLGLKLFIDALVRTNSIDDAELFSEEFRLLTKERVKKYCQAFKRSDDWMRLGFETS
ncbi:hypothetical protein CPB84DRAFT_1729157 [Gymnopilus junonius]|uniref:Nucleotidyltransferase n=1 Tax=Gymnopilus junonius TaxID=109634 RepID=A0A9P5TP85_GYMJU|nr:hypothetical protein CPB84DRAFT_1729157 [Gymnopilus junonius]